MLDAKEILADKGPFAFRRVPDVDPRQLHMLSVHPDPCVRQVALDFCPRDQIPFFVNDTDDIIRMKISRRLKA